MSITFGKPYSDGRGICPGVALSQGTLFVAVHTDSQSIKYRVGNVDRDTLTLRLGSIVPLPFIRGAPSVAIRDDVVVCVFEHLESLYYLVGAVSGDNISFGGQRYYDQGLQPSIALGTEFPNMVEVHKSQITSGIYCRAGAIDIHKNIVFGGSRKFDTGQVPKVALMGSTAVSVHRSEARGKQKNLYYNVGKVVDVLDCSFSDGVQYYDVSKSGGAASSKPSPAVALTNSLIAIEVHNISGDHTATELSYFFGTVNPATKRIDWPEKPTSIGQAGGPPSIAVNDSGLVVLAYTRNGELIYQAGRF